MPPRDERQTPLEGTAIVSFLDQRNIKEEDETPLPYNKEKRYCFFNPPYRGS